MIDAHIHLHDTRYDNDRGDVIKNFFAAGGEALINIGTSVEESRQALAVAQQYNNIYAVVGMHPHIFNGGQKRDEEWMTGLGTENLEKVRMDALQKAIQQIESLAAEEKVVAIGEIGLDYFLPGNVSVSTAQKKWQRTGFVVQIALARKLGLPVVVHCRPEDVAASDAYFDCAQIIADYADVQFVMHCYMGNEAVTREFLELPHVHFSFTGNVTFSKSDDDQMSKVLAMIPLERMMVETDGPYLTPVPHRGKRNDPQYIGYVAERIADIKDLPSANVLAQATQNTKIFLDL